jgi:hypothetical protein
MSNSTATPNAPTQITRASDESIHKYVTLNRDHKQFMRASSAYSFDHVLGLFVCLFFGSISHAFLQLLTHVTTKTSFSKGAMILSSTLPYPNIPFYSSLPSRHQGL